MGYSSTKGQAIAANSARQGTAAPNTDPFPFEGNVRPKQVAKYMGIGKSTLWLWIREGKFPAPLKLSERVSVWDASVVRDIAANGFKAEGSQ